MEATSPALVRRPVARRDVTVQMNAAEDILAAGFSRLRPDGAVEHRADRMAPVPARSPQDLKR